MTCSKISNLLTDFLLNELPADEAEMVNNHLKKCPNCRTNYILLQQVTDNLHQYSRCIELPPMFEEKLEKSLLSIKPKKPYILHAVLALVPVLAMSIGILSDYFNTSTPQQDAVGQSNQALIAANESAQTHASVDERKEMNGYKEDKPAAQVNQAPLPAAGVPRTETMAAEVPSLKEAAPTVQLQTETSDFNDYTGEVPTQEFDADNRDADNTMPLMAAAIPPDQVVQSEIITQNGEHYLVNSTEHETLAKMASAVNRAVIISEDTGVISADYQIKMQLSQGIVYTLHYNLENNAAYSEKLFAGQPFRPDAAFPEMISRIVDK